MYFLHLLQLLRMLAVSKNNNALIIFLPWAPSACFFLTAALFFSSFLSAKQTPARICRFRAGVLMDSKE